MEESRMNKKEILERLEGEIERIAKLKNAAFNVRQFDDVWLLSQRMDGLFYARHLISGNLDVLECYETGRNNSHGARLSRETQKLITEASQ